MVTSATTMDGYRGGSEWMRQCEEYARLDRRPYFERKARYQVVADRLSRGGVSDRHTVVDVGAGWTELDICLRLEHGWRGRYLPVDGWIDGVDLDSWAPEHPREWHVAIEVLEHLHNPLRLVRALQGYSTRGVVITTPNPAVVDVLAMDPTHVTALDRSTLEEWGFYTTVHNFYGTHEDGIAGLWCRDGSR